MLAGIRTSEELMLGWIFLGIRWFFYLLAAPLRWLSRPPDFVVWTLEGSYAALPPQRQSLVSRLLGRQRPSLQGFAEAAERIARDRRVRGVLVQLRALQLPLADLQTLRAQLERIRAAGKRVVVWGLGFDTRTYYLASAADRVLLQPGGSVLLLGQQLQVVFLRDLLDELGVELDVLRSSGYKSAYDMFTRRDMSPELREMLGWLADSVHRDLLDGVAERFDGDVERARELVDGGPYTDEQALAAGLVDACVGEGDVVAELQPDAGGRKPRLAVWQQVARRVGRRGPRRPSRHVALLRIEGTIVEGESQAWPLRLPVPLLFDPRAGDATVVRQVRALQADRRVAAVLLHVDSPGGSAAASEAMTAALERLAAKKPLICVMGARAASGGYCVATPARLVFARPATLTGSIGVILAKVVAARLLAKARVSRESILRGARADLLDSGRAFNDEERALLEAHLERTYDVFADRVATGRRLTREAVDAVGRGRVWTGRQALEHGLVDALGGLPEALARARELAKLPPRAPLVWAPVVKTWRAPEQPPAATEALGWAWQTLRSIAGARPQLLCMLDFERGDWP